MNTTIQRQRAVRRETPAARNIPYEGHLSPGIIDTSAGDCLCVLRLSGAAFECADDSDIFSRHNRLNRIVMSLADPRIGVWQHIVRRQENQYPDGVFPPGYAHDLNARYRARVSAAYLMANELYLTVVLRPFRSSAEGLLAGLFGARTAAEVSRARQAQVVELEQIMTDLEAALGYYEPERLALYPHSGMAFTQPAEFFRYLISGRSERVPYLPVPLKHLIGGVRPLFGSETVEVRNADASHFGAMLGIHGYPDDTPPGFLNELLAQPFEMVITQSFQFRSKDAAGTSMTLSRNRKENAGDAARSQIKEIDDARDDLESRRTVFGAHHFSVLVKADTLDDLKDNVADARRVLTDAGIQSAREDLALEPAYWAQLPGVFNKRPRLSPINSRNLCGFAPLHNFPVGRRSGNHWGEALTQLITAGGSPLYFSLHASDPQAPNGGGKKDVGHTALFGPSGCGKTATACFLLNMMQKFDVTSVLFSMNRDTEIAVRLLRGKVYPLRLNQPTGLNPFALQVERGADGAANARHLHMLVRKLISRPAVTESGIEVDTQPLSVAQDKDVQQAVSAVLTMPLAVRRLGRVLDFLPKGDLHERLARWCYAREDGRQDGPLAWVFDNPVATVADELGKVKTISFDTTDFIDDPELRTPITLHLFHLAERLMDGRRLAVFFSEYWKSMADKHFAAFLKDLLKTLRKKNGLVIPDTQSPSDALRHPLARTIIEQIGTLILFPNPGADRDEYMQYLGLSQREFDLVKTDIPEGSGMFLLKQGRHSVVARLPLAGMDDDLSVLSARTSNLALMDRLIEQHGDDPDDWFPHFLNERRTA